MNWQEFTEKTKETAVYPGSDARNQPNVKAVVYLALGLAGETGETVDLIKKQWRKTPESELVAWRDPEFVAKLRLELGDVFWYAAQLISVLGLDFEEVLQANLDKLAQRKAEGTLKERHTSGGVVLAIHGQPVISGYAQGGIIKGEGPVTTGDHAGFVVPQRLVPKAFFDALEALNDPKEDLVDPAERDG